uniref:Uncharacterized protein n=1 Tax=Timema genevievae TaxID=629358 RepID=A0A7R9JZI4_TIMGE|nr:unnamed protein product [Timema genevievae]
MALAQKGAGLSGAVQFNRLRVMALAERWGPGFCVRALGILGLLASALGVQGLRAWTSPFASKPPCALMSRGAVQARLAVSVLACIKVNGLLAVVLKFVVRKVWGSLGGNYTRGISDTEGLVFWSNEVGVAEVMKDEGSYRRIPSSGAFGYSDLVLGGTRVDKNAEICTPKESKNHDISLVETCKEIGNNESPSPVSSHSDKRPPSRRFSYTSTSNRIANNIRDVPYARLMDHSPTNLLQPKLDSDSKLNNEHNNSTLGVPEKEQTPKSSVSDSKLAVNYFTTASAEPRSLTEVVIPGMGGRCNPSDTHHILDKVESVGQEVQRTVSMSSENHSEAFYSADEEVISQHACSSASRTSSLRHSAATSVQDSFMNRPRVKYERQAKSGRAVSDAGYNKRVASATRDKRLPAPACRMFLIQGRVPPGGCPQATPGGKKFSSEMNIVPNSSHMVPLLHTASTGTANTELQTHLTSHRSDHEIHTPEHRNQQLACGSMADMPPDWLTDKWRLVYITPPSFIIEHGEAMISRSLALLSRVCVPGEAMISRSLALLSRVCVYQKLEGGTLIDSSDTHSLSSTSFISAVSSQEDMTLVNLHVQVNKPIVDSPLLMSSYITHLSQVGCHNWTRSSLPLGCDAFTVPLFEQTESGHLIYIGYRYTPRFETLSEGFTSFKMVGRPSDHHTTPPHSTKTPTHPYVWDTSALMSSESGDFETDCEEELLNLQNEYGNRTTLIIKLKGDMDVMITPLVLESLQRKRWSQFLATDPEVPCLYLRPLALMSASLKPILWDGGREGERRGVASQPTKVSFLSNKNRWITKTLDGTSYRTDAVTPTLASQHPLTVLNHLHARCVSKVEDANILKRDKSLSYLSQFQTNKKTANIFDALLDNCKKIASESALLKESSQWPEDATYRLLQEKAAQMKVVNITVLQASVVEEIISFSALDNIRDLTCVSLFAICFDNITTTFHFGKQWMDYLVKLEKRYQRNS